MNVTDIARDANLNGGGSYFFDLRTKLWYESKHSNGFWVSEANGIGNLPKLRTVVVTDFIRANADKLKNPEFLYNLGIWKDENGNFSIDVSTWFASDRINSAIRKGQENFQRSIFDIENNIVMRLHFGDY